MKRAEFAPTSNGNTRGRLFRDVLAKTERLRDTARMLLGRTAVEEQVKLPKAVVKAVQTSPTDAGKLSFRGWMARRDYRLAAADPTPENRLRATNSARYAAQEAANPNAPINQISSPDQANKATYDWGANTAQVAPAVIGGNSGNVYHNPARSVRQGVAPMEIHNGGYFYSQPELDALNAMPSDGLVGPGQLGHEPQPPVRQQ